MARARIGLVVCDPCRCKLERYQANTQTFDSHEEARAAAYKLSPKAATAGRFLHVKDIWFRTVRGPRCVHLVIVAPEKSAVPAGRK